MAKCLGSMNGVVLLSEIHPMGVQYSNPLAQAMQWYPGLLDVAEVRQLLASKPSFREVMLHINSKAQARGKRLVIRDWSHLDFTGVPFIPTPSYRLSTAAAFLPGARLIQAVCVRHPIDQWLSVSKLEIMQGKIELPAFLEGCRRFAEEAVKIGFVRYEDFTRDPDGVLKLLCEQLEIEFDPGYRERWAAYGNVTGDGVGRGANFREIKSMPRAEVSESLIGQFGSNQNYRIACELLDYKHPE